MRTGRTWNQTPRTAYSALNLLAAAAEGPEYASHATTRLSQITQDALFLQHIQAALLEHFTAPADA